MGEKRFLLLEPFESAWAHMRRTLFQPFLWQKWFAWGLLAFIGANIQHGGGFPNIFSYIMDEQEHRSDHFTGSGFPAEALPAGLPSLPRPAMKLAQSLAFRGLRETHFAPLRKPGTLVHYFPLAQCERGGLGAGLGSVLR